MPCMLRKKNISCLCFKTFQNITQIVKKAGYSFNDFKRKKTTQS